MKTLSMSTEVVAAPHQFEAWRSAICEMIHRVQVRASSTTHFKAHLAARRVINAIGCAYFHCDPHEVICGREQLSDAGAAGYLISWQLEGEAFVSQNGVLRVQRPGDVAIVDGRLPMAVAFPADVKRLVAKLPARLLEQRIPRLARHELLAFTPQGPLSGLLYAHLREMASAASFLQEQDAELMAENICNLLRMTASREPSFSVDSGTMRGEAIRHVVAEHATDPELTLGKVALLLNMSTRSVQKALQEAETSFTELLADERIQLAERMLLDMPALPVSQVAYRSGFNDVSNFNHQFKRRTGVSPTAWRACRREGVAMA